MDDRLAELTMPVTLIWGENDGLLSLDYANALQAKIAGSRLHVIDGAAHSPHRQAGKKFSEILLGATT